MEYNGNANSGGVQPSYILICPITKRRLGRLWLNDASLKNVADANTKDYGGWDTADNKYQSLSAQPLKHRIKKCSNPTRAPGRMGPSSSQARFLQLPR